MKVNVFGTFYTMKYAIKAMLKYGGGSIVNLSSILGSVGSATGAPYTASKHAVVGLTKAAALDYAEQGIRVNAIGPGVVETSMTEQVLKDKELRAQLIAATPLRRFAQPEEIADLILFLCSDRASFITGAYYPIDGGYLSQ
jgi:NAD(P)-dependent dehydrogenase (short-subunit alcohol dehydrogenase family)